MNVKKNPHAVALGRIGGRAKGLKGANLLPPEKRSENARKAALAMHAQKKARLTIDNANRLAQDKTVHESKRDRL